MTWRGGDCRTTVPIVRERVQRRLVAFSNASFEFADEVPEEAQHGSLANLPNIFASLLYVISKVAGVGLCA